MFDLIFDNPIRFILALIIGLLTAWWIWGRISAAVQTAAPTPAPVATPAPAPKPVPVAPPPPPPPPPPPEKVAAFEGAPKIAAAVGDPDDLKLIKGIGPKLEKLCNKLGVTRFDQIAAWKAADIAEVDPHLDSFSGRIQRDDWVGQAKILAKGGTTEFASRNS
jgi:predicted flap endonuclease-1-like 5' DNA nuclease